DEALNRGANIANCSWGMGVPSAILEAKVTEVSNAGMLVVAASGNDNGPVMWPAVYEACIAVGAVGPTQLRAPYSNFGQQLDIVAPGGDSTVNIPSSTDPGYMISTGYFCQTVNGQRDVYLGWMSSAGTSFAAPMVSGALALLISNGKTPVQARRALLGSAKQLGVGVPNSIYGYGLLDVYAALTYVPINVMVEKPRAGDTISTLKPLIRINLGGVSAQSVIVTIDGTEVINGQSTTDGRVDDFTYNQTAGSMVFSYLFSTEGSHRIAVAATSANDSTKTYSASSNFRIKGLTLATGLHFISRPYPTVTGDPEAVLGTPLYRLARAVTSLESGVPVSGYALYNYPGLTNDPRASFKPPDVSGGEVGGSDDTLPRGLGYWLNLSESITLLGTDFTDDSHTFDLYLSPGWNQAGNPYPFPVALTTLTVSYGGETLNMTDAVKRGWVSGTIYSYANGAYVVDSLPGAIMQPWIGYWVRSKVPLTGTLSSVTDPRGVLKLNFVPLQAAQAVLPYVATQ
ncbi:MAG: S8 family serine peptidase, partial [Armatimonadota bacterium]